MKKFIIGVLKLLGLYHVSKVPKHITQKYLSISASETEQLKSSIINTYLHGNLSAQDIDETLTSHIAGRLENFRNRHIYFLDSIIGLKGKKILEIGCGTGSSSIALAEQGAEVTGLDVDEDSLVVAAERAKLYKLSDKIVLKKGNATEADELYPQNSFDVVIFFASIEHMTYEERIDSLKAAWNVLKKGGALCILGTPNRLWFYDPHTSNLPFYFWLPDEIAFKYSAFSSREYFNKLNERDYEQTKEEFARWGRGVSYHEVELAVKPMNELTVLGDLHSFERPKGFLQKMSYSLTDEYKFKKILAKQGPKGLHPGFYEYYLDVAILKS